MDFATARSNMVKSQVAPNNVTDPSLLTSMVKVSREAFVDEKFQPFAYSDLSIPAGEGRRYLTPLQAARLIQALNLEPGERVLVLGAGTGYEASILANMGMQVFAVESHADLAARGQALTGEAVSWQVGELSQGWPEESPFDGVLICGAVHAVPNKPIGQLGKQGRLVAITGRTGEAVMHAVRMVGIAGGDRPERIFETTAGVLPGFDTQERFVL